MAFLLIVAESFESLNEALLASKNILRVQFSICPSIIIPEVYFVLESDSKSGSVTYWLIRPYYLSQICCRFVGELK